MLTAELTTENIAEYPLVRNESPYPGPDDDSFAEDDEEDDLFGEDDEEFDDEREDDDDLHEIQVGDDIGEPDPEDDDHFPEEPMK